MAQNPLLTYLVTGGAGFIGSHLLDALLADSTTREVRVLDNFSSGRREHLAQHAGQPKLKVTALDLLDLPKVMPHFQGVARAFHLAANPETRSVLAKTR